MVRRESDKLKRLRLWVAILIFLLGAVYSAYLTFRPRVEVIGTLASAEVVRYSIAPPWTRLNVVLTENPGLTYWTRAVPKKIVSQLQSGDVVKLNVATAALRASNSRARTFGVSVGGVELRSELQDIVRSILVGVLLPLAIVGFAIRRLKSMKETY